MSSLKHELMRVATNNVGDQIENLLERAKQGVPESEGGLKQAQQFVDDMDGLAGHIKKDVDEGKYDIETAKHVMLYVSRAKEIALNHAERQRRERLVAAGRVEALTAAVAQVKKTHDVHQRERDAAAAMEAEARMKAAEGVEEPTSRYPVPLKQRKAEEAAAEAAAAAAASDATAPDQDPAESEQKTQKRARTRR